MKKVLLSLSFAVISVVSFAQSGSLSPYAMYGIGCLSSQANSQERGMAGIGQALREGNQINSLNPASYSSIDSLTFLFDIGMSLDRTFYREVNGSSIKTSARNTGDFEYMMAAFRVYKHVGVSFGIQPVSTLNYGIDGIETNRLSNFISYPYSYNENHVTATTSYDGDGGIRQAYVGAGWEPIHGFSIGFNVMYMWGNLTRDLNLYYSDSSIKQLYKISSQKVNKFRFNVGAQYTYNFTKEKSMTIGATFTPKTHVGGDAMKYVVNYSTTAADTTYFKAANGYSIPGEFAVGISYRTGRQWFVGLDYDYQNWSSLEATPYVKVNGTQTEGTIGSYYDRHSIKAGTEWCYNPYSHSYFERVKLRAGFGYTTPYLKLKTLTGEHKGPREITATLGFGLPITNNYNNRSMLNIGFQWVNESGSLISENTIRINIGLTFNEKWFAKWKFE